MKIRFISDFARNWKAGEIVDAEILPNGDTLVDNVACIDTTLLMEHCEVVTESDVERMNREKYIKDKSYRDGYEEGHKEGINAVINTYNVYLNRLEEDINYLREQLKNIKAESEE